MAASAEKTTYLITGASSGLGLEIVTQLAARGDKVFCTVRKKASSATGIDNISKVKGDVTIIEGVDVMADEVKDVLASASVLKGITIDVIVHNAGGMSGGRGDTMKEQALDAVTAAKMARTFNLNCLGPLRVQQALQSKLKSPGGKVCVISTGMGSIGDNNQGGMYAYRCSKAAVNMLAKGMSVDLKKRGIAVTAINPGMVATGFGPGQKVLKDMGAMTAKFSVKNLIKIFDGLTIETTGGFMTVTREGPPKLFPGGW